MNAVMVVKCRYCGSVLTGIVLLAGSAAEVRQRCPDRGCRMWNEVTVGAPRVMQSSRATVIE